ncbi:peptidoglycan DD-metalloendopeptidase family protein [Vibrio fluvialis]|jgi:murein DD-endopeptidase MepM/ murein hydrolase activator NlpD|uniref:Membrane protein n=1 Tax=Vibrio fluvialis PG41 TaxID=1336752 RepID=S7JI08_VIBFL|nr:M23 family metallopeptidase [Vibrio fluvialis]EKO3366965.1 peptidoglycan DD-metalloendopeptidase family protein [Vibrio fluvialis]EKO3377831.1 peptidoglycan DD-metalloendopeptidase family protein [Vibrio fluvialis]EKO3379862.1 peptidoglycan DD-metalloendopeptidase family protein [Vibrio fluvialis]EKO3386506.1 peptidoglycan DD-metalloendopeptidase family protein [Vibrio fluvialis]EKO3391814.1 peptidoglycan DD-metalloendopeptidase family protein [Vibrio fluvialis]
MKENVIVSVSSIHGTRHFHIGKWFRHCLKGFGYFLLAGAVAAGGVIYYLVGEVDFAKLKQQELESQSTSLNEEVASLKELKDNLENDLLEREEKMQIVSDRLGDLEKVLGVEDSGAELESRLDTAAITSSVRMVMLTQIPSGAPVHNARISSGYGKRVHPVTGQVKFHRGQDFAVNTGTPVYAPADGVVEVTRASSKGSGNFLRLQHSYGFTSSYSHLQKFAVKSGDFIQKGDLIGYSGNSGLSSGPHLHYEIRFVGRSLDPRPFVDWGVNDFESIFTKVRGIRWESLVNKVELRVSAQLQLSSQRVVQLADNSG